MSKLKSKLAVLEKKLEKLSKGSGDKNDLKPIPTDYKDFFSILKIRSDGIQNFNLYDYQEASIETILNTKTTICCKSRQLGYSQLLLGLILWLSCLKNGHNAVVLSKTVEDAGHLAKRFRFMAQGLADDGYINILSDSLLYVNIENNQGQAGSVFFKAASSGAVGIDSVGFLFLDEVSIYDDLKETLSYALPTTSNVANPHIVLVGTPRGLESQYFDRIKDIVPDVLEITEAISSDEQEPFQVHKSEKANSAVLFSSWKCHPKFSREENFLQTKVDEGFGTIDDVRREYDMCFTISIDTLYTASFVNNLMTDYQRDRSSESLVYLGLDTSGLTGNDHLVLTAFESNFVDGKEQYVLVDMLRMNKGSYQEALFNIEAFISKYPNAFKLNIEANSHGRLYYDHLVSLEHTRDMIVNTSSTTGVNKIELYDRVRLLGDMDYIKVDTKVKGHKYIVSELLNFRLDGSSKSDDIVSSIAYACIGIDQAVAQNTLKNV